MVYLFFCTNFNLRLIVALKPRTHLERFVLQVHFQQRVSHQVPETAAVEITVRFGAAPAVVDLRELQPAELTQIVAMEILMLTEHLCTKHLGSSHP